jgi:hypothetical protein
MWVAALCAHGGSELGGGQNPAAPQAEAQLQNILEKFSRFLTLDF